MYNTSEYYLPEVRMCEWNLERDVGRGVQNIICHEFLDMTSVLKSLATRWCRYFPVIKNARYNTT